MAGLIDWALKYASHGIPIFPCEGARKRPNTVRGFKDASCDLKTVKEWWEGYPRANIGMPTGIFQCDDVSPLPCFVFDVDPRNGGMKQYQELLAKYGPFPITPRVRTTDGGLHFYFRLPDFKLVHKLPPGVDIKQTGGYVLLPPSLHPKGYEYEWKHSLLDTPIADAPDWLLEMLTPVRKPIETPCVAPCRDPSLNPTDITRRAIAYADATPGAIDGEGGSDITFGLTSTLLHGFELSREEVLRILKEHHNPKCVGPWTDEQLEHKIDQSRDHPPDKEPGWMLVDTEQTYSDVDISGIAGQGGGRTNGISANCPDGDDEEPTTHGPIDPGPLPTHLLDVEGFIGEMAHFIDETNHVEQPILSLAGATAFQGFLAGRKVRDPSGARSNLNILGVAETCCGKERARAVCKSLLAAIGAERHLFERPASYQGVQKKIWRYPQCLLLWDEIGQCFRAYRGTNTSPHLRGIMRTITELYTSSGGIYVGDTHADEKNDFVIDQPSLSIYGTSTPAELFAGLTEDAIMNGFVGRMLLLEGSNAPEDQFQEEDAAAPESLVGQALAWHEFSPPGNLTGDHPEPVIVPRSDSATEVFHECVTLQAKARRFECPIQRALWGRTAQKTAQLALVYACSKYGANVEQLRIDREAAEWALAIVSHVHQRLVYLTSIWIADDDFHDRQNQILRFIRDKGGAVSARQLTRRFQRWPIATRKELLDNLLETKQVRTGPNPKTGRGAWWFIE